MFAFFFHPQHTHKFALNDSLIKLYMYHNHTLICIHGDAFSQMVSSHTAAVSINFCALLFLTTPKVMAMAPFRSSKEQIRDCTDGPMS
jgi:UDP-2,3-diacylglucosamine pyrophosphatase LpxH